MTDSGTIDQGGMQVIGAVVQGMTSWSNSVTGSLIDSLTEDANRYKLLRDLVEELAIEVDSRHVSNRLFKALHLARTLPVGDTIGDVYGEGN